ncbi:MAG: hypothetical protein JWP65_2362 [Ramlibacter sp.]|jgi:hypothetical protein|uniref:hypothetical protein n=1 Tax=Ramlibacter sp. TaxID=1917967 RepID=UPI0026240A1A|nr:hypothetical protein [Ramlibacter sp.]MDB5751941.1 hypothetical protein [Ramlibacter sp.]
MDTKPTLELARTELKFLQRLLLDLQRRLGQPDLSASDEEHVAALELALAVLRWDGAIPLELDAQVGLGAVVQSRLGPDAMCAYRHWRAERRKSLAQPAWLRS